MCKQHHLLVKWHFCQTCSRTLFWSRYSCGNVLLHFCNFIVCSVVAIRNKWDWILKLESCNRWLCRRPPRLLTALVLSDQIKLEPSICILVSSIFSFQWDSLMHRKSIFDASSRMPSILPTREHIKMYKVFVLCMSCLYIVILPKKMVYSVKCYRGGRKMHLISSISEIQSQTWYHCIQYTKR